MNKLKNLLNLIILMLLSSIIMGAKPLKDFRQYARKIRMNVGDCLEKRHKMKLIGEGGAMLDRINSVELAFQIFRILDQNEARRIVVDCVEELLGRINRDGNIRPYLKTYPFKTVRIALYIYEPNGKDVFYPEICVATFHDDKILYKTDDKVNKPYRSVVEESYEEALKIVKEEKINSDLKGCL